MEQQIPQKSKFELLIEFLKPTIWPFTLVFIIFLFWTPINKTLYKLPDLLKNSESITIGGLSVKIGKKNKSTMSEKLIITLSKLTENDIDLFLRAPNGVGFHYKVRPKEKKRYSNLIKIGIYREDFESNERYYLRITDLGKQTDRAIKNFIADVIKEIAKHSKP